MNNIDCKKQFNQGFTLIELMIVVAIIGVLAAVSIPTYATHKTKAFNASAISYLQFIATGQENYWVSNQTYISIPAGDGPSPTGIIPGTTVPSGVGYIVGVFPSTSTDSTSGNATGTDYTAYTGHIKGSNVYALDSRSKAQTRIKKASASDPASDAKSETITTFLPANWGRPL